MSQKRAWSDFWANAIAALLAVFAWNVMEWAYEVGSPSNLNHIVIVGESKTPVKIHVEDQAGEWNWEGKFLPRNIHVEDYPRAFTEGVITVEHQGHVLRKQVTPPGRYGRCLTIVISQQGAAPTLSWTGPALPAQ